MRGKDLGQIVTSKGENNPKSLAVSIVMASLWKSVLTDLILIARNWLVKSLSCKHLGDHRPVDDSHLVLS